MRYMNVPSYNALTSKDKHIKVTRELCEVVNGVEVAMDGVSAGIAAETERAENAETALASDIEDLQAMEQIVIDGGEAQIAQGSDFTDADATKRAKVPTVGAILDGLNDGVYDVSARNGGATFESLSALLSSNSLSTLIPTSWRKGGMSIRFVLSSDNNSSQYVEYRLMKNQFSTIPADWQGVDEEPVAGSKNLVESGGMAKKLNLNNVIVNSQESLSTVTNYGIFNYAYPKDTPLYIKQSGVANSNTNLLVTYADGTTGILVNSIKNATQGGTSVCTVTPAKDIVKLGYYVSGQAEPNFTIYLIGEQYYKQYYNTKTQIQGESNRAQDAEEELSQRIGVPSEQQNIPFIAGSYVSSSGNITSQGLTGRTDYIDLSLCTNIKGKTRIADVGCCLAFFDENKDFLPSISIIGESGNPYKSFDIDLSAQEYSSAKYAIASYYNWDDSIYVEVSTYASGLALAIETEKTRAEGAEEALRESVSDLPSIRQTISSSGLIFSDRQVDLAPVTDYALYNIDIKKGSVLYISTSGINMQGHINMLVTYADNTTGILIDGLNNSIQRYLVNKDIKAIGYYSRTVTQTFELKIYNLNNSLSIEDNILKDISWPFNISGKYINNSGEESSSGSTARTEYIPIYNRNILLHVVTKMGSVGTCIAFFDKNMTFLPLISVMGTDGMSYTEFDIDLSSNDYVEAEWFVVSYYQYSDKVACITMYQLNKDIKELNARLSKIEETVGISKLRGKTLSILGDSISTYSGYIPQGFDAFYPKDYLNDVNKTWWKKLTDETGMQLGVNNSWSGSRVSTATNSGKIGMSDDARLSNLGNPDIIVFFGGVNDYLQDNALGQLNLSGDDNYDTLLTAQAYQYILNYLEENYPNAKIYACSSIQNSRARQLQKNSQSWCLYDGDNALKQACDITGVEFVDLDKCGITRYNYSQYTGEGLHPNESGMELIKECILRKILSTY